MTDNSYPVRARAHVRLTVEPPLEKVKGFRKDGRPRVTQIYSYVMPGQIFYIRDEKMLRELINPEKGEVFAELVGEDEGEIPYEPSRSRRVLGERTHTRTEQGE